MINQFQHCLIRLQQNSQSNVFKQTTVIYTITLQEQLRNERYSQSSAKVKWTPVKMLDLRRLKEVTASYGLHSSCETDIKLWLPCNRIIPKAWRELVTTVLEPGTQLQLKGDRKFKIRP